MYRWQGGVVYDDPIVVFKLPILKLFEIFFICGPGHLPGNMKDNIDFSDHPTLQVDHTPDQAKNAFRCLSLLYTSLVKKKSQKLQDLLYYSFIETGTNKKYI